MAAQNHVRQSVQRTQSQEHKSKKASFCPPRRGFGFHSQSAPAFASLPADALVKHAITTSAAAPIQAKLTVGAANDPYEQEADKVARQVVTEIRQPQFRVNREEEPVQRVSALPQFRVQAQSDGGGAMAAPQDVERGIAQARGKGQPLRDSVREPMERAFGADFGGVRVHTDGQADQLSQSIQAKAFTTGRDVFFKRGAYQPGSKGGQELIAHELTHVVQQDVNSRRPTIVMRMKISGKVFKFNEQAKKKDILSEGMVQGPSAGQDRIHIQNILYIIKNIDKFGRDGGIGTSPKQFAYNSETNTLCEGHHRFVVAHLLGKKFVTEDGGLDQQKVSWKKVKVFLYDKQVDKETWKSLSQWVIKGKSPDEFLKTMESDQTSSDNEESSSDNEEQDFIKSAVKGLKDDLKGLDSKVKKKKKKEKKKENEICVVS